jgi:ferredoxin
VIEHIAARANSLRSAFGLAGQIVIGRQEQSLPAPVAASGAAGVSRRGLFSLLAGRSGEAHTSADVAGRGVVLLSSDAMPKMQLPVRLPARRQRLIEAMNRLTPDPASPIAAGAATGLWAQFGVTKDCDGCAMCAYFCPTGALQKIERDGRIGLAFRLAHCTNCRLCQDVCVRGAVALSTDIDLRKALSGDVDIVWLSRPALPTPMAFAAQVRTSNSALQ